MLNREYLGVQDISLKRRKKGGKGSGESQIMKGYKQARGSNLIGSHCLIGLQGDGTHTKKAKYSLREIKS